MPPRKSTPKITRDSHVIANSGFLLATNLQDLLQQGITTVDEQHRFIHQLILLGDKLVFLREDNLADSLPKQALIGDWTYHRNQVLHRHPYHHFLKDNSVLNNAISFAQQHIASLIAYLQRLKNQLSQPCARKIIGKEEKLPFNMADFLFFLQQACDSVKELIEQQACNTNEAFTHQLNNKPNFKLALDYCVERSLVIMNDFRRVLGKNHDGSLKGLLESKNKRLNEAIHKKNITTIKTVVDELVTQIDFNLNTQKWFQTESIDHLFSDLKHLQSAIEQFEQTQHKTHDDFSLLLKSSQ